VTLLFRRGAGWNLQAYVVDERPTVAIRSKFARESRMAVAAKARTKMPTAAAMIIELGGRVGNT
jgi:hypothetical protein